MDPPPAAPKVLNYRNGNGARQQLWYDDAEDSTRAISSRSPLKYYAQKSVHKGRQMAVQNASATLV